MSRPVEEIVFEAEYLRLANNDLRSIIDLISEAAASLSELPVALLEAATSLTPYDGILRATTGATETMTKLREIQDAAIGLGELVGGRIQALTNEMNGEEPGPDE